MRNVYFLFLLVYALSGGMVLAGSEEWVRKAGDAAGSLARGDVNSAVYNALPTANVPLKNKSQVSLSARQIGFHQPILPTQKISGTPFSLSSGYNASVPVTTHRPNIGQNVNVGLNSPYVQNNTTFSDNQ
jgi:hypothetical protein